MWFNHISKDYAHSCQRKCGTFYLEIIDKPPEHTKILEKCTNMKYRRSSKKYSNIKNLRSSKKFKLHGKISRIFEKSSLCTLKYLRSCHKWSVGFYLHPSTVQLVVVVVRGVSVSITPHTGPARGVDQTSVSRHHPHQTDSPHAEGEECPTQKPHQDLIN